MAPVNSDQTTNVPGAGNECATNVPGTGMSVASWARRACERSSSVVKRLLEHLADGSGTRLTPEQRLLAEQLTPNVPITPELELALCSITREGLSRLALGAPRPRTRDREVALDLDFSCISSWIRYEQQYMRSLPSASVRVPISALEDYLRMALDEHEGAEELRSCLDTVIADFLVDLEDDNIAGLSGSVSDALCDVDRFEDADVVDYGDCTDEDFEDELDAWDESARDALESAAGAIIDRFADEEQDN